MQREPGWPLALLERVAAVEACGKGTRLNHKPRWLPLAMTDTSPLFQPLTVKSTTLRNRIVMSPMTRRFSPNGIPTDEVANYYRRRAERRSGPDRDRGSRNRASRAIDDTNIPVMHGDDCIAGWKRTVGCRCTRAGGVIFPQLWHMGPMRKSGQGPRPESRSMRPSGIWGPLGDHVVWGLDQEQVRRERAPIEPMSHQDIGDVIDAYARSASCSKQAALTASQFMAPTAICRTHFCGVAPNQRTDNYGGDVERRTTFVRN